MSNRLVDYLKYKNEYLKGFNPEDLFKVFTLFEVKKTNMPIKFYEKDGKYIAEIIDPEDSDIIHYRKTLSFKSVIDLTYLYSKYKEQIDSMNVEFNKISYLNRLDDLDKSRAIALSIKNSTSIPDQSLQLRLDEIENQYNILKSDFENWYSSVEKIMTIMNIIKDVNHNVYEEESEKFNEYTIGYYWLNSKTVKSTDDTHYIMNKLIIQTTILNVGDIVKYADNWYIVTLINSRTNITIQNIKSPNDIKTVSTMDIQHEEGHYHVFKDYKIVNNIPTPVSEWVMRLPSDKSNMIMSKLTYQSPTFNVNDIVLLNGNIYIINSIIDNNNINIQNIDTDELLTVTKDSVEHPIGFRNKYKNIIVSNEIILPINSWLSSYINKKESMSSYINERQIYHTNNINKGDVVMYNKKWYIIVDESTANSVTIRNLETLSDKQPITVSINEIKKPTGYYHNYKNFKFTDNLVISIKEWRDILNRYGIPLEDIEEDISELTEYPANNNVPSAAFLRYEKPEEKEVRLKEKEMKRKKIKSKTKKSSESKQ
jgi:hypothetical protein